MDISINDLKVDYEKDSKLESIELDVHKVGSWLNEQHIPYDFTLEKKIPHLYRTELVRFFRKKEVTYEGFKLTPDKTKKCWVLNTRDDFKQLTPTAKKVLNRVEERLNLEQLAIGQDGNFYDNEGIGEILCEISNKRYCYRWDKDYHKGFACEFARIRDIEKIPDQKLELVADDLLFVLNAFTNYWVCDRETLVKFFDRFDDDLVNTLGKAFSAKAEARIYVTGFDRKGSFF